VFVKSPIDNVLPDGGFLTLTSIIVGGEIPYTYLWTGPGIVGANNNSSVNVNSSGTYNLSVTSNTGCSQTGSLYFSVITPTSDTEAPTTPTGLLGKQIPIYTENVSLSWEQSTDNVGVTGYNIYRNNSFNVMTLIATTTSLSYIDNTVLFGKEYDYYVTAIDAENNESLVSNTSTVFILKLKSCLVEGTMITDCNNREVLIEDLNENDGIMSSEINTLNDSGNITELRKWDTISLMEARTFSTIKKISSFKVNNTIIINKGLLEGTPEHIQLVQRDGVWLFIELRELINGDNFYGINKEIIEVYSIDKNTDDRLVYNIELSGPNYTYYANNILTHNKEIL